jgi:hypothetical protein
VITEEGHRRRATRPPLVPDDVDLLHVEPWPDPVIDSLGHDPRSAYVERFWLCVLGPTATWLMRRIAAELDDTPTGFDLDVDEAARALGLGGRSGRHSPFQRALARCVTFEVARSVGVASLGVRRNLPPLPRRHMVRLPPSLQEQHGQWMATRARTPVLEERRSIARRLALGLRELEEDRQAAAVQLARWRVHPAIAHEAVDWAWRRPAPSPP